MTNDFSLIDNIVKDVFSKKIDRNEVIRQFETLSDDEKEQLLGRVRSNSLSNSAETKTIAGAIDNDLHRESAAPLIFQEYWQEVPLAASETEADIDASHARQTIVFSDENRLDESPVDANAGLAGDVIYVIRGERFQKLSDRLFCCRANDEVQLQTLFRRLVGEADKASSVVYAWSKGKAEAGIHELFTLFKAVKPFASQISQLTLLGHYDRRSLDSCWDYAWIGFQRTLKLHYPATVISIVYNENIAIDLKQAIALSARESVAWLRGEQAYRLSVRAVDVAQKVQAAALKQHGGYLITGGVGALGFTFARHLASQYQANLILVGRRPLSDAIRKQLDELKQLGACEAVYEAVDIRDEAALKSLALRLPFELAGVIHAAGVESDKAFFEKSAADVRLVMGPKTIGTLSLDQAFGRQPLDFICYFSSSAALLGDFGGCDYAIANRFQMGYGAYREQSAAFQGKTIVINWPLWDGTEGGMGARSKDQADFYLKTSGQKALSARDGVPLWCDLVKAGALQSLVMIGDARRITSLLQRFYEKTPNRQIAFSSEKPVTVEPEANAEKTTDVPDDALKATVAVDLKRLISAGYKIAIDRLEDGVHLAEYGLDSINLTELAQQLTAHFSIEITPALFFSYISIDQLSDYLVSQHGDHLQAFYRSAPVPGRKQDADPFDAVVADPLESRPVRQAPAPVEDQTQRQEPIAIIGMAGRFPDADTVDELWALLSDSRNAITEVPESRWNWRDYFIAPGNPDNKITTNRGGFIRDIEHFDALFFDISPREARDMDPAQQLLLMESYRAIENAGLSPQSIRGSRTAVFVGMEESQHEMLNGWRGITTGGAAMIASRLSYFLDLHGPAIVTNTACSSGLVALHQAAMSLRQGECDTALVASVALTLSPHSYITMSRAGMLSPEGVCRSFAANADGIGVGEAVVVLMLKPLTAAVADGNPIHGVLKASGINFDGKTNGVTAPNGRMQAELIERIYTDHKVDIDDIGHIVAHGTGTKLGDPVEVNALHDAFKTLRDRKEPRTEPGSCAITSCKGNLGHTMAASGLVSVVSLLQSIRHHRIPASLHCEEENPHFNRANGSLYINRTIREWHRTGAKPRLGAVSAFGRSGTNAHVVIEEYLSADPIGEPGSRRGLPAEVAIPLSARTADQLRQRVHDLLQVVDRLEADGGNESKVGLADVAYTLQTGRDAMAHRLGVIVASLDELKAKLRACLDDAKDIANVFRTAAGPDPQHARALARDSATMTAVNECLAGRKLPKLLELWVEGLDVDWQRLHGDDRPRRISLPGYPFAGETSRQPVVPVGRAYETRADYRDDTFGNGKMVVSSSSAKPIAASSQSALVVIGGAGLFGLCMGVFLKKANIPFRIIEKNEDVGGVWFVNRWPGCGCDIPMLAYAYSFEHFTGDIWAKQPDILKYLQTVARKYDLYSHITFNTKIKEANWQEDAGQWLLTFENEETIAAKYYVHAANEGQGHIGNIPNIPGMDEFQGSLMHALDCRADDWDFTGKRIAIIGNGTTQIQLVETLQPIAERLVVYARSPKYIYPRATYGRPTQQKLGSDYQFWLKHRGEYLATADEFYAVSNDPVQLNPFHPDTQVERYFSRDMNEDWRSFYQWLREIDMVPDYLPGCSRPCMSHTYHRQIRADNVELKTVPAARITATGIETENDAEAFDIILLATGYDLNEFKPRITVRGRNRLELSEYFGGFPKSHAGIAVPHFPNFFLGSGPNSGTNATSITAIYEHSCENLLEIIRYCEANHVKSVEARKTEAEKFVAFVRERNRMGSFSSGCSSWYQTKKGENVAVFPGTLEELKRWRDFNPDQYHFEHDGSGPMQGVAADLHCQSESGSSIGEPLLQPAREIATDRAARRPDSPVVTEQMAIDHVQGILTKKLSAALEIDPDLIDYDASFADYGIDSIMGAELVQSVNAILHVELETNHLFDYGSVEKLSHYVLSVWGAAIAAQLTQTRYTAEQTKIEGVPATATAAADRMRPALNGTSASSADRAHGFAHEPIAVIGMSGRFAESESIDAFWENLRDGKDLVKEVSRWDKSECISPGSTETAYCSRGSFVDSVDLFDPAFFKISPLEAMYMDPQQRIFLEDCWTALEYAGYAGKGMDQMRCGVFAGCSRSEYAEFFSDEPPAQAFWGNAPSVIPARIAYYLNLLGPAISVDTACSSSLVSIHLACQSLWSRETDMALAGGVFLQLKPDYHQVTNRAGMLSLEGKCRAFDAGANGFVPGEGVGVVVLKRFQDALRDGDTIHGVIAGSGMNQDGSTNGITAPSAQSQQRLELSVYEQFDINPETIQLIEAHGTGTRMGDPVEFKALTEAFRQYTDRKQFCAIGSVKANIGHATLAAGIASVLKVLMALKHRQIPALLHFERANPAINFLSSPFYPCTELSDWNVAEGERRRAAISSFGISGTNAHMVIEEMPQTRTPAIDAPGYLVVLSARTAVQLKQQVVNLLAFCRQTPDVSVNDMSHTLFVGRMHLPHRFACVARSLAELVQLLEQWLAAKGKPARDSRIYAATLPEGKVREQGSLKKYGNQCIQECRHNTDDVGYLEHLATIAELYVQGYELDFHELFVPGSKRIALPTYPFARERHWVDAVTEPRPAKAAIATELLHPLLHRNTSDLAQQRYSSVFTGEEFFLKDHEINGRKILPAVAYLEMVRAAVTQAMPERPEAAVLELRDIVWLQPLAVAASKRVSIDLSLMPSPEDRELIGYEVYSLEGGERIVHSQGKAAFGHQTESSLPDIRQLQAEMRPEDMPAADLYAAFAGAGVDYGPAHQGVASIRFGNQQCLARLTLPAVVENGHWDYELHPSLMDSALQASVNLLADLADVPNQISLPFALKSLRLLSPCTSEMFAWVRFAAGSQPNDRVAKLDIDLMDRDGRLCVRIEGLSFRAFGVGQSAGSSTGPHAGIAIEGTGSLLAVPAWEPRPAPTGNAAWNEHHVVLCEIAADLFARLPDSRCLQLQAMEGEHVAERYSRYALTCFEQIRSILKAKPSGKVLLQVVVPDHSEQTVFAGLSGLLKSAALENPLISGQVIVVDPTVEAEHLADRLRENLAAPSGTAVRYRGGVRHVLRWREERPVQAGAHVVFRDQGVYLVVGGLGGLGTIFTREILGQVPNAHVVLTGRAPLTAQQRIGLQALSPRKDSIDYCQLDVCDAEQVAALLAAIQGQYKRLNGILHCAGMIADQFILTKTAEEFRRVLAPKVTGTWHLDQASRHLDLDFLVLFSSQASAMGSMGQADYATANGFMDQFAGYRNHLVAEGERRGRTLSVNWPLWQDGGMAVDEAVQRQIRENTGMHPMRTETGLLSFYQSLGLSHAQVGVTEGDLPQIRQVLFGEEMPSRPRPAEAAPAPAMPPAPTMLPASDSLLEKAQDFLGKQLSALLKLPASRIDPQAPLEQYGIDSILTVNLTNQLEKTFGPLSKTLLFEHQTIRELTEYFVSAHADKLGGLFAPADRQPAEKQAESHVATVPASDVPKRTPLLSLSGRRPLQQTGPAAITSPAAIAVEPIAIIGLSGRYPQAFDIREYWQNLRDGKDCITEVPKERWDWRDYFSEDRSQIGHHFSKWGGFIEGVDEFDPFFFNMSPREAEYTDPQERLFLQHAWMAVEDAGYTRAGLQVAEEQDLAGQVGVYVGVMYGEYQLFGAEASLRGNRMGFAVSLASIANRVSYVLNLHGPSMTLDTMCSSSLTAIHLACQDLKQRRTSLAIAGGVNTTVHPNKYLMLSAGQFISSEGRCQSFGVGGDGYIPAEGVGAVVLKRLSDAQRDQDHIYGVIKGSALNHGGKTNGYTVPNPQAQTAAIRRALAESGTDPRHISYIEAHGTGTKLGDPIEIAGLTKAFGQFTEDTGFCFLGSAKSNIGHGESAAGIAGLTKVLLQMKHQEIVPSLHSAVLNPNIDFDRTPFVVNQSLRNWENPVIDGRRIPRIAGISSFGAGGSNAHLIIEEYLDDRSDSRRNAASPDAASVIVLSAKNELRLREVADNLRAFITENPTLVLSDVAYTLQIGREAMEERLGVLASSLEQLSDKLQAWLAGEQGVEDFWHGQVKRNDETIALFSGDADLQETIDRWIAQGKYPKLLELWVKGLNPDWNKLYGEDRPHRISLPAYPFARDRYWTPEGSLGSSAEVKSGGQVSLLAKLQHSMSTKASPTIDGMAVEGLAKTKDTKPHDIGSSSWDQLSYRPVWNEQPASQPVRQDRSIRQILLVYGESAVRLEKDILAECRRNYPDAKIIEIRFGRETRRLSDMEWSCDIDDPDGFHLCLKDAHTPDRIFFVAGAVTLSGKDDRQIQYSAVNEIQLLRLVKALQQHNETGTAADCFILTLDNHQPDGAPNEPDGGGLTGLAYALAQGDRRFLVRNIDLTRSDFADDALRRAALKMMLDEAPSDRGTVIKIKAGRRYQQSFLKWQWDREIKSPGLREGGVYLIAGGSGTVGQIITHHLIERYRAKVVWLGRTAENDRALQKKLAGFQPLGASPWYIQADVTQTGSLRQAIDKVKHKYSVLSGAIFSSLVFHPENSIAGTTEREFTEILDVKISGSRQFHAALQDEPLDFLCYFSSVQSFSFLSAKDSAGYATGITFADAEARSQRQQSRFPVGIVNWGYWEATVKGTPLEAPLSARFGLIRDEVGVRFFDRFISQLRKGGADQLLCMPASQPLQEMMGLRENEVSYLSSQANPSLFARLKEEYYEQA